jgi:hypothetical protein
MKTTTKLASAAGLSMLAVATALAGAHTWDVWEIFTNADGTIQFVELRESEGGAGETFLDGRPVTSSPSGGSYEIENNLTGTTSFRSLLLATAGFAALPGAPTPDETLPDNFLELTDTSVTYAPYNTASWPLGTLPSDGYYALTRLVKDGPLARRPNSPKNYATNTSGVVNLSGNLALPAVPEGGVFGQPMRASRLTADGSVISISWDLAGCPGEVDHQIVYGQRSGFPTTPGGTFTPLGGVCNIGTASPFSWNPSAEPSDGSGLIWFLIVTEDNAGTEGPWGSYNGVTERSGPGAAGSSGVCLIASKDVSNLCGH